MVHWWLRDLDLIRQHAVSALVIRLDRWLLGWESASDRLAVHDVLIILPILLVGGLHQRRERGSWQLIMVTNSVTLDRGLWMCVKFLPHHLLDRNLVALFTRLSLSV